MFTSVHNESGNVNRVALGSETMNPIEPCVDNIRVSRESVIMQRTINIKDGLFGRFQFVVFIFHSARKIIKLNAEARYKQFQL